MGDSESPTRDQDATDLLAQLYFNYRVEILEIRSRPTTLWNTAMQAIELHARIDEKHRRLNIDSGLFTLCYETSNPNNGASSPFPRIRVL